jgi:hypothetical protein
LDEVTEPTSPVGSSSDDLDQASAWSSDSDETTGARRFFRSPEDSPIGPTLWSSDGNVKVTFVPEDNYGSYYERMSHLIMVHPQVCFFFISTVTAVVVKGVVYTTTSLILT